MKDPLDQTIDALLASRPVRASDDFTGRVLAEAEADAATRRKRPLGKLLAVALPLAAAVVLTLSLLQLDSEPPPAAPTGSPALTNAEAQEIFLLEESLAGLAAAGATDFGGAEMLHTLDALYLEI